MYVLRGRSSNRKGPRQGSLAEDRLPNGGRTDENPLKIAQAVQAIRTVVQGFARRCSVCETPVPRAFPV
ncbi:hypothetical protein GCM10010103_26710 [Streptomyces paradoxus]